MVHSASSIRIFESMLQKRNLTTLIIGVLLLLPLSSEAQVVWTEPAFPAVDDNVTLYYNSMMGNEELSGVIPIYIHTGVITSNSAGPSDWQNVQTTWGIPDSDAALNPEGNGIHSFDFNGLSIAEYYNIDEGEEVESLAMVFRNASGSLVGREADLSDIFYAVSNGSFSASLMTPALGYAVLQIDEELELICQSSEACELSIVVNGTIVSATSGTEVSYTFSESQG